MALVAVHKIRENVFYDPRTGNLYYDAVEDITDVINFNLQCQQEENNGFSEDRSIRMTSNIPVSVWQPHAKKVGYYQMDKGSRKKELERFLAQEKQYCTTKDGKLKHDTANQTHLIIK